MRIITRLASFVKRALVTRVPIELWRSHVGGVSTTGVIVNESRALSVSAIFAAVRAISEDVATAPLDVFKRLAPRGKEQLFDHWLVQLLDDPCPEMTGFDFRACMVACALLFGNSYAEIERARNGKPIAVWPIEPWRVVQYRDENNVLYYSVDSKKRLETADMLHLKGFTLTGIVGEMLIRYAKDSIGLLLGAELYAARWFNNAATPSGYIESEVPMNPDAAKELSEAWAAEHAGVANTGKPVILANKKKWVPLAPPDPEQAQLLETRLFNLTVVCQWFRIPPTKISNYARATWSNSEQQALDYLGDTLGPWFTKIEQEIRKKIIKPTREPLFIRHVPDERTLRTDSLTNAQVQMIQIRTGVKSIDEVRDFNGDNALPDGKGEQHLVSSDLVLLDSLAVVAADPAPESSDGGDGDGGGGNPPEPKSPPANPSLANPGESTPVITALTTIADVNQRQLADSFRRALHTEADKALRAAKRGKVSEWSGEFYSGHEQFIRSIIETPIRGFIDSAIAISGNARLIENKAKLLGVIPQIAKRHVEQSLSDLVDPEGLEERVNGWVEHRGGLLATEAMNEVLDGVKSYWVA